MNNQRRDQSRKILKLDKEIINLWKKKNDKALEFVLEGADRAWWGEWGGRKQLGDIFVGSGHSKANRKLGLF